MAMERAGDLILVTGAAGKTGLAVLRKLLQNGLKTRAFVHRPRHRAMVEKLGADHIVEGDLRSGGAVADALRGVGSVYHICPNVHPEEVRIGRVIIDAARQAGAKRLVFHSVLHPQIEAMPHHWAKLRVEEHLFESGLDFTILQPAPYMQNVLGQWHSITEEGICPVPYDLAARVVMVDLEDVAEVAAQVLSGPGHAGATYELCGPDLLDQREIAALLSESLDRPVRAEVVPLEVWTEKAKARGMGRYQIETLIQMFRYYERFGMAGSPGVLAGLLHRRPRSFAEFLDRLAISGSRRP